MSLCLRVSLPLLVLVLGGCKASDIPRSPAPWITLGASKDIVTSLDTSRIVAERTTRVVWVRQTHAVRDSAGAPAKSTSQKESRHRVDCGARTVTDLDAGPTRPFKEHPYGPRVFATVCNALGNLATKR
ncbi:MAG: hypothetical protein AVDCRST_MAG68-3701 [uncultured Gemmatimonadetes bacterium]|uniref:Lipoprotein n=1 Tax=uncultured Gemmatimonadota bacterium TaxID=203437 RepID=A0A6J4M6A8_9BACT|nr:MAG: hypothetical protein AVDCRST_MAG68-3701 [uncultured Gemmatimonadota bacterium]